MAEPTGFLDQLGVGSIDERALMEAQRDQAFRGRAAEQRALGQQASPVVHGMLGAVGGLITGNNDGRSVQGFKDNLIQGAQAREEQQIAQAAGLSVETLRARRAIRQAVAGAKIPNDGSFDSRMAIAKLVAKEATKHGDIESLGKSLQHLDALRKEQAEFDKLQATEERAEEEHDRKGVRDIWLRGETTPRTGQVFKDESTGLMGMVYADGKGGAQFAPVGTYSFTDPTNTGAAKASRKGTETVMEKWKNITAPERRELHATINAGQESMRRIDRILSNVNDLARRGGADSVMSTSGKFVSFLDNAWRNVKGVAHVFSGDEGKRKGMVEREDGTWVTLENERKDLTGNAKFWARADLPENLKKAAAASQQFQANLMELAYMAARLAEPSNRGLSDNDIRNAMVRLAGDSSNPQVIMRRFAEMTLEATNSFEDRLDLYRGYFDESEWDEYERIAGGTALTNYRNAAAALKKKFGFEEADADRAKFDTTLDADVQPGEGIPGLPKAPGATPPPTVPQEDLEFLDGF